MSPRSQPGAPGKVVTITGTNLSEVTSATIGTAALKLDTRTATELTVTVPAGAHTGAIRVKSLAGTAISKTLFTVT